MKPDQARLEKLPGWAQEYISGLEQRREAAVRALREFAEQQSPSSIYYEAWVCDGEKAGPSAYRRYVQSRDITIEFGGVQLAARIYDDEKPRIELQWGALNHHGEVAMIPRSFQHVALVAKENMR